jgi:UDP-glucose:(heptosyl)LPS alpha-1,3-glucosyltransferase
MHRAGAERSAANLARGLAQLGVGVSLVAERVDAALEREFPFCRVQIPGRGSWGRARRFAQTACDVLEKCGADVSLALCRVPGAQVFRATDPLHAEWVRAGYAGWRAWWEPFNPRHRVLLRLERETLHDAGLQRIVAQSRRDAELLQRHYQIPAEKIRLVPNGIDVEMFYPGADGERAALREDVRREFGLASETPLIAFAAMDFRRKGLPWLLEALAGLRASRAVLVVLGDGDLAGYGRRARRLGIAPRVVFAGRRPQIARYFRAADLLALPTIYEPFPNVVLEALACGLPVVTTATAGGADVVRDGENGFVIPRHDSLDELTRRMDELLSYDAGARAALRERCVESAAPFTRARHAERMRDVCREALSCAGARRVNPPQAPCLEAHGAHAAESNRTSLLHASL